MTSELGPVSNYDIAVRSMESLLVKGEQVDLPLIHHFGPGIYVREMFMPAGTFAIGQKHKHAHLSILLKGKLLSANENGTYDKLEAPMIMNSRPGRKVLLAMEDSVLTNLYPTSETDLKTIEDKYIEKTEVWKEEDALRRNRNLDTIKDVYDYAITLKELSLTDEFVRNQMCDESNQIPMPMGSYKIVIWDSPIEGMGVFATAPIDCGEIIGPARINGKQTPIGRYANHSGMPNAKIEGGSEDNYLIALRKINGNNGGFFGEEITINYRETLKLLGEKK